MSTTLGSALIKHFFRLHCFVIASYLFTSAVQANTLLIWPVRVVLMPDQRSVELWLENRSEEDVSLQVRVFEWTQSENTDKYQPQTMLIASPPFSTIGGGKKQLIRLVRAVPGEPNREYQFRILIDEIPRKDSADQNGVQFQMRYSVPAFFQHATTLKNPIPYFSQHLKYRIADGQLQIQNDGEYSARISRLSTRDKNHEKHYLTNGLLGYVLPGATMSWPFDKKLLNGLLGDVNGDEVELTLLGAQ